MAYPPPPALQDNSTQPTPNLWTGGAPPPLHLSAPPGGSVPPPITPFYGNPHPAGVGLPANMPPPTYPGPNRGFAGHPYPGVPPARTNAVNPALIAQKFGHGTFDEGGSGIFPQQGGQRFLGPPIQAGGQLPPFSWLSGLGSGWGTGGPFRNPPPNPDNSVPGGPTGLTPPAWNAPHPVDPIPNPGGPPISPGSVFSGGAPPAQQIFGGGAAHSGGGPTGVGVPITAGGVTRYIQPQGAAGGLSPFSWLGR